MQSLTVAEWLIWNESFIDLVTIAVFTVGLALGLAETYVFSRPKRAPAFIKRLSRSRRLPSAMGVFWVAAGAAVIALAVAALCGSWLAPGLSTHEQSGLGQAAIELAIAGGAAAFVGTLHWRLKQAAR